MKARCESCKQLFDEDLLTDDNWCSYCINNDPYKPVLGSSVKGYVLAMLAIYTAIAWWFDFYPIVPFTIFTFFSGYFIGEYHTNLAYGRLIDYFDRKNI